MAKANSIHHYLFHPRPKDLGNNTMQVRAYIANQEKHHKKQTLQQEYEAFLAAHGFMKNNFG
ncbi:MAG TPA: hypothetical protein VFW07_03710 [Parafilimonas sp.]|nr:hypothetical protein [Parafilimonas sp.]